MTAERVKSAKRNDIQGLRSIAILGVLAFHLAPKYFANGFLGVDLFFVLSGYLMSSILAKESNINWDIIQTFYIRRVKRIVPLYAITLVILTIITPIVFIPDDISHFIGDLEWALPFAENMQNVVKKFDYWTEVFNSPVLLHLWSLGVEIQYYLIVPFIMIIGKRCEERRSKITLLTALMIGSYLIHIFSSSVVSFGLLFSRMWQFLVGSIAFELREKSDRNGKYEPLSTEKLLDENDQSDTDVENALPTIAPSKSSLYNIVPHCMTTIISYPLIFILALLILYPSYMHPSVCRALVTIGTGLLLWCGKHVQTCLLDNEIMVYIGDLSYVIYLSHWPVIILYKYYNDVTDLSITDVSFCLMVTLVISVLCHHTVESFFIRSSTTTSFIFILSLYSLILLAIFFGGIDRFAKDMHKVLGVEDQIGTYNKTVAIQWNLRESKYVYFKPVPGYQRDVEAENNIFMWTGYRGEHQLRGIVRGNGTAKVLLIGNSYGYRAFPVLLRLFAGRFSEFRMFTKSSQVVLSIDREDRPYSRHTKKILEMSKPDITFIIQKDSSATLRKPIEKSLADDEIMKFLQSSVDFVMVIIDYQYYQPHLDDGPAYRIQKLLQKNKLNFDELKIKRTEYESEYANEIKRMDNIIGDNVIKNRVEEQLCGTNEEFCYFYNRENLHAYYGDKASHLTSEGLQKLEPGYAKIIEDSLIDLNNKSNKAH